MNRARTAPRQAKPQKPSSKDWSELGSSEFPEDHLGNAAESKHAAKAAIKEKRLDDAWRLLHDQQRHWLLHANRFRFTKSETLSLLSSIHEDMANVLRLEKRHDAALSHLIYCLSTAAIPTQAQRKKLGSYFSRCKFSSEHTVSEMEARIKEFRKNPQFTDIQKCVAQLRDRENQNDE